MLLPTIGEVLAAIANQKGCLLARMSGSGATCFGLFGSAEDTRAAHEAIVDKAPHWWSVPTEIGGTD
jgi:4-diphosphocytidyl-2-C-methyl-D-erythritol kinase